MGPILDAGLDVRVLMLRSLDRMFAVFLFVATGATMWFVVAIVKLGGTHQYGGNVGGDAIVIVLKLSHTH
eukprot:CAMPEP_0114496716 /NCGR_PEP_ID=MMETSP0109-20121206/5921_1 /TAXON_ID=29199 /ORGANISM="Chlorarachnion reptans, Strain CCCM449" /LENGTH=69 /DNA_ID=CAMNT_0001674013 /DNA_START=154 /DNA_END=363 /DNA_ORIENTATION=-